MKPCRVCANAIPASARYCTHCESYQNWQRHVQLGQTTLPMLVALVAVMGALVPPLLQWLDRPNSRLVVSGPLAAPGTLSLTFSNLGNRPGVIDGVSLSYEPAAALASRSGQLAPLSFTAPDNPVVGPNEVRKLPLPLAATAEQVASWLPAAPMLYDQPCTVAVRSIAFDGTIAVDRLIGGCQELLAGLSPDLATAFRAIRLERLRANPVPLPSSSD